MLPLTLGFLVGIAHSAPSVDTNSQQAVQQALTKMVDNLMGYYLKPGASSQGTINPNTSPTASGFQWYEGGIMWGAISEYMRTTGDVKYATEMVNALTLGSYGTTGSFLGTNEVLATTIEGKWNDDILWWGLGPAAGAELFGKDVLMPGGVTYVALADKTYQQVQAQYEGTCGGGLWWSRDRSNPKTKSYKSTITQCQQMVLGSRLAILTGNQKYNQESQTTYNWMKSSGIIASDWTIFDGVDTAQNCGVNGAIESYKSGFLTGGLAWLYQATKNTAFITDAHAIFAAGVTRFAGNGVLTDPCEAGDKCQQNQVSSKGTMVRGWGYLSEFTPDQNVRNNLKTVLKSSVDAMLQTCDDSLNCGNLWSTRRFTSSNVHFQMNSVELMTSYLKTFTNGPVGTTKFQPPSAAPPAQAGPPKGSAVGTFSEMTFAAIAGLYFAFMI